MGLALAEYFSTPRARPPSQIWAISKGTGRQFHRIDLFYAARMCGSKDEVVEQGHKSQSELVALSNDIILVKTGLFS